MRQRLRDSGHLPFIRVASVVLIAGLTGACSTDTIRLAENPFSNPFASSARNDAVSTGAVPGQPALGAPRTPTYQPLPGNVGPTGQLPAVPSRAAMASPRASAVASAVGGSANGWTSTGGTPVTLGQGDTVEALSGRYGVPVQALRATNGLAGNAQPQPGQQFIIPAFNPGAKATTASIAAPVTAAPVAAAPVAAPAVRAPRYESLPATPAAAKARPAASSDDDEDERPAAKKLPAASVKPVEKKASSVPVRVIPMTAPKPVQQAAKVAVPAVTEDAGSVRAVAPPKAAPAPAPKVEAKKAPEPAKVAKAEPKKVEPKKVDDTPTASIPDPKESQEFRWPARGRVISGFGAKGPSGANDGINIAVPEGTPVKAAEGGTVAYAGEEIKGYGKMVLIRHPNGYVSAYAHNGDLNVKRGDTVKRGQVIAKSGQTGNVTSPQLHFELRKGSEPVDPSKYLE